MRARDRSFLAFGIYLGIMGTSLVAVPETTLGAFGFDPPREVWVRVCGMLVLFLAFYYVQVARRRIVDFYLWTVQARMTVIVFFGAFVLFELAPPMLALFGVADFSFAFWTWRTLVKERAVTLTLHPSSCIDGRYSDVGTSPRKIPVSGGFWS